MTFGFWAFSKKVSLRITLVSHARVPLLANLCQVMQTVQSHPQHLATSRHGTTEHCEMRLVTADHGHHPVFSQLQLSPRRLAQSPLVGKPLLQPLPRLLLHPYLRLDELAPVSTHQPRRLQALGTQLREDGQLDVEEGGWAVSYTHLTLPTKA